jgi:putative transposase
MEAMDCDKDHIHLLSGTHPKIELDRIVQIFKRITAHEIFRRKPAVQKELCSGEFALRATTLQQSVKELSGRQ